MEAKLVDPKNPVVINSTRTIFNNKVYWINAALRANLDVMKREIKNDWDFVIAIDGVTGGGKSVLAQQIAGYLDPNFHIGKVCLNAKEFRDVIINSEKYAAVIYDEAVTGLGARESISVTNRALISMMAQIRQKNLYVIMVIPSIFDLDRNIALDRAKALLHVYTKKFKRGYFAFYNRRRKTYLFQAGKKFYDYSKPKPNFRGNFPGYYILDENAYREKKLAGLVASSKKFFLGDEIADKLRLQRDELIKYLYIQKGMSALKISIISKANMATIEKVLGRELIDLKKSSFSIASEELGIEYSEEE